MALVAELGVTVSSGPVGHTLSAYTIETRRQPFRRCHPLP
jgi:hypothetical protein